MGETGVLEKAPAQKWVLAHDLFPEFEHQATSDTTALLGELALSAAIEPLEREESNNSTLMAALQLAALGDAESICSTTTNVTQDIGERLFKAGQQSSVSLKFKGNRLSQNGRLLADTHSNTLRYTILNEEMYGRSTDELKNVLLFEKLATEGVLEDNFAVVFSLASTDPQTKKDYRFYEATDTCSIQLLDINGENTTLKTALVAGKARPNSPRHDFAAVHALAAKHGIELDLSEASRSIKQVVLIPKSSLPNDLDDLVMEYDIAAGGTFYGEGKPPQDYLEYAAFCRARNDGFDDIVKRVTEQLISEAHLFTTPLEAIERLDYLSERLCVQRATEDRSIAAAVFGPVSAAHINQARYFIERGDNFAAQRALRAAQRTAQSGACPLFKNDSTEEYQRNSSSSEGDETSTVKKMHCPYCTAVVFADPCAKRLSCWDCNAEVVDGKVVDTGNGGSRARNRKSIGILAAIETMSKEKSLTSQTVSATVSKVPASV